MERAFKVHAIVALAMLVAFGAPSHSTMIDGYPAQPLVISDSSSNTISYLEGISPRVWDGSIEVNVDAPSAALLTAMSTAFAQLREVRGYLKVTGNFSDGLEFLGALRVIRGLELTDTVTASPANCSLFIDLNTGDPTPLRLSLIRVLAGNIVIQGTVCGLNFLDGPLLYPSVATTSTDGDTTTVNLGSGETWTITLASTDTCATFTACETIPGDACSNRCWGPDQANCQLECDPSCTNGCVMGSPSTCCDNTCTGGCATTSDCFACADDALLRTTDGMCISQTDCTTSSMLAAGFAPTEFVSGTRAPVTMKDSPFYCTPSCDRLMGSSGTNCTLNCPSGLVPVNGQCANLSLTDSFAGDTPPFTPCMSTFDVTTIRHLELIDAEDCDTIRGSLILSLHGKNNLASSLAFTSQTELAPLNKIRRIRGELVLFKTAHTDLSFLSSLAVIDGLYAGTATTNGDTYRNILQPLTATPTSLRLEWNFALSFLNLQGIVVLRPGSQPRFLDNFLLCLHSGAQGVNWTSLGAVDPFVYITPERNHEISDQGVEGLGKLPGISVTYAQWQDNNFVNPYPCPLVDCGEACSGQCWGVGNENCQRCSFTQVRMNGVCVSECDEHYFDNSGVCVECHESCESCFGTEQTQCLSCFPASGGTPATFLDRQTFECVLECKGAYPAIDDLTCEPCDSLCTACTGPSVHECTECVDGAFLLEGSTTCARTCDVTPGFFFDGVKCAACSPGCAVCSSSSVCDECKQDFFLSSDECVAVKQCAAVQFQSLAPTATTDAICTDITQCVPDKQYIALAATASTDVVCANCTECDLRFQRRDTGTCDGNVDAVCSVIDRCDPNPCLNNGTCTNVGGFNYTCACVDPFCGENCNGQFEKDECVIGAAASLNAAATAGVAMAGAILLVVVAGAAFFVYKARHRYYKATQAQRGQVDCWEIERSRIKLSRVLGKGKFGIVSLAHLIQSDAAVAAESGKTVRSKHVAVKEIKPNTPEDEAAEFFEEIGLMKLLGKHRNVLSIEGVCTLDDPIWLVLEYAADGDLRHYLMDKREDPDEGLPAQLVDSDFFDFGAQIAAGMQYVASLKIVHRDLAARNVLVANGGTRLKVADFGLARRLAGDEAEVFHGKRPVAWTALESLPTQEYTLYSDVWSFGIVLWEIAAFGAKPYGHMDLTEVYSYLQSGNRMASPPGCPDIFYKVMMQCWDVEPKNRPSYQDVIDAFAKEIGRDPASYVDNNAGAKPTKFADDVIDRALELGAVPTMMRKQIDRKKDAARQGLTVVPEEESGCNVYDIGASGGDTYNDPLNGVMYDNALTTAFAGYELNGEAAAVSPTTQPASGSPHVLYDNDEANDASDEYGIATAGVASSGAATYDMATGDSPAYDMASGGQQGPLYDNDHAHEDDLVGYELNPVQGQQGKEASASLYDNDHFSGDAAEGSSALYDNDQAHDDDLVGYELNPIAGASSTSAVADESGPLYDNE
eukprot:m.183039 g.183039  ORF g.183039 m.183039 type:complete len:1476 (+) comp14685_c0_seq1:185-4612(+)